MTDAVRVRGLRKSYRGVTAVDGVDLDIAHGEIFALLGPNGAGKTTTVEILEGYRRRDAGEVSVLGEDPQKAPLSWRYGIGLVLQDAHDMAELTVAETVAHFARYYPRPHDPAEVIEMVGLTHAADKRIRTLSGGQRRRVDVAIGVVGRPRLLFLDEPTTGFDPVARRQFWGLLGNLAAEQDTTILLTTHYLDEAEALADRVAVIAGGRIVAVDHPSSLGGRSTANAHVRWIEDGTVHTLETPDPVTVTLELSHRLGGDVPGLTITRPTLEDAYLQLIGDSAR
ncbi:ABC transporter ATP-binding protein [Parafrankia discariae]|uniref:ABC transporter ATP-binding protein n=1 Tax=Parafrankia discariae TaxID=365528 RepID=UPI00037F3313|nr:ABC transporter ATP-binding protein [Parafrankia discariae]